MYDIAPYHDDLFESTIELLRGLHGSNDEANKVNFQWKYHDNPYADRPLGIVALHKEEVVGFRGYMAQPWNRAMVLCAGDTIVHRDHRKSGLSIAMGQRALEEFGSDYQVMVNFACNQMSLPGYRRLGFEPLVDKIYFHRDIARTEKFKEPKGIFKSTEPGVIPGKHLGDVLAPTRDKRFLKWRLQCNKREYVFYNSERDYILLAVGNNYESIALDHTENDPGAFKRIMQYIMCDEQCYSVMIKTYSLNYRQYKDLEDLGFQVRMRKIPIPVLVRPTGDSWTVGGLDIRQKENWLLRSICSDNL